MNDNYFSRRVASTTNVTLNSDRKSGVLMLAEARQYSSAKTKRALVEEALATYVAVNSERRKRQTYEDRLQEIRAKAATIHLRSDSRDILRRDRDSR